MKVRSHIQSLLEPVYRDRPRTKAALKAIDTAADYAVHSLETALPALARPRPKRIFITLTARCNLRCSGCLYGANRFDAGKSLPWPVVRDLLDDAAKLGIRNIRLYGGEPMMHRDLSRIVAHAAELGLNTWMTTNGALLKRKFAELHDAGLRNFSFGFYGVGEAYDEYVGRKNSYARLMEGLSFVRDRYGAGVNIKMDWLLMRPTCTLESLRETFEIANRFSAPIYVNLIHYSLPYFNAEDQTLQFSAADRPVIQQVVDELLRLKAARPDLLSNSRVGLRSIPDWLIDGPRMRVPCTESELLWVGADGTVQMCYVTFKLGNLHERRLSEMLYTAAHRKAAGDCVSLKCPNCHCSYDRRTNLHAATRRLYA